MTTSERDRNEANKRTRTIKVNRLQKTNKRNRHRKENAEIHINKHTDTDIHNNIQKCDNTNISKPETSKT